VEKRQRAEFDAFRAVLKEEWWNMWNERFDDKMRAEGVSVRDYQELFMNQGDIIFAGRNAKTASFSEVVEYWSSQGFLYSPEPAIGGWGKFIRTELRTQVHSRAREFRDCRAERGKGNGQLKKSGRGWLHVY
jgi:hypothetical protein